MLHIVASLPITIGTSLFLINATIEKLTKNQIARKIPLIIIFENVFK